MNTPKIRFKGFTDDWEQRKLGELCNITTGKLDANAMVSDGQYDFYTSGIDVFKIDVAAFEGPAITIAGNGASVGYMHLADGKFNAYQRTYVLTDFLADRQFLNVAIGNELPNKIQEEVRGSGIPYIVLNMLTDLAIPFPSHEEQYAIGVYFQQLDHLITLHQRKCDETKQLKKFMLQKMFPKNGEKNPEIRFKGFTDDWEQRKLGDVLICLQNNSFSRADLSNETGVAKNVHYGDVLVKFGEVLDVSKEQLPMISDERVLIKYKASFLQNGDVIVADTAENSTVGKCSEIAGLNNEIVLSGLHTIPYRPKEKFASGYLGYYLNSDSYHNQLIPLMQGIKVTAISKSALRDTDIIYPESKEEQAKIGNYFQSLDHLITLHQRKCEKLKELKKFMLQNMFV